MLLFYPVGYIAYTGVNAPPNMLVWSVVIGAAVILWPVLLLKIKDEPCFRAAGGSANGTGRKLARRRR